jgi:hypothetical protein
MLIVIWGGLPMFGIARARARVKAKKASRAVLWVAGLWTLYMGVIAAPSLWTLLFGPPEATGYTLVRLAPVWLVFALLSGRWWYLCIRANRESQAAAPSS